MAESRWHLSARRIVSFQRFSLANRSHEQPDPMAIPDQADVDRCLLELPKAFQFAPLRRGAGPGGGTAELWGWMPQQVTEWPAVQSTLLRFALGHVPQSVMAAYMSCRIIAGDREEADKVRPLGLGTFIRKCINRAKTRTFKNRVAANQPAIMPLRPT